MTQPGRTHEAAGGEGQGRTCACADDHPVYCTAYRYNESPETVRYNGDECPCVCHCGDEDEDEDEDDY
jgi:hypothetical protein